MIVLKIVFTVLLIATVLFVKSLIKLSVNRQRVEREYSEFFIQKFETPGVVKQLKITPLIDYYTENPRLQTEAGVSYYIEVDQTKILLDVGANDRKQHPSPLISNMKNLGKTFEDLDFIYLSHLHRDHVGGVKEEKNSTFSVSGGNIRLPEIPVYSPEPVTPSELNPGPVPEIIKDPVKIKEGIISMGAMPRALFLMGYTLEHSLAFNVEGKGIVIVIGCGHQSIERIIERASHLFDEKIYGIIGGLHLPSGGGRMKVAGIDIQPIVGVDRPPWKAINAEDAEAAIDEVKKVNPALVAISPHDSSDWTLSRFKEEFGSKYTEIKVGQELVI